MAQPKITGIVRREGRPLGGAYVRLIGPSGDFVSEQYTPDDGSFVFYVAPGSWTVEVKAAQSAGRRVGAEIGAGETVLDLELLPA